MQSPPDPTNTNFFKQPLGKSIIVGLVVIVTAALFFLVTKGSTINVCLFSSDCVSIIPSPPPPLLKEVLAVGVGAGSAALLTAVIETPLIVAVGIGIAIWWIVNSLL